MFYYLFGKSEVNTMPHPVIDKSKCKEIATCIDVCPVDVFAKEGNEVIVKNPDNCIGCRACEVQCPNGAIKIID